MIGTKFHDIEVVEKVAVPKGKNPRRGPFYRCLCHRCGRTDYIATSGDLRTGRIKTCGCYRASQEFADSFVTHGHRRQNKGNTSGTYTSWLEMKKRCDNPLSDSYQWYGGRGITYQSTWRDFQCFLGDLGERPAGTELDRIDGNGNYTKDNCRWVTHKENCNNRNPKGYRSTAHDTTSLF